MTAELRFRDRKKVLQVVMAGIMIAAILLSLLGLRSTPTPATNGSPQTLVTPAAQSSGQLRVRPVIGTSSSTTSSAAAAAAPADPASPASTAAPLRETRALWVSRWDFKDSPDVQAIVDKAAYAHLNTILFQVRGQADAMYPSSLEPWAAELTGTFGRDPGYDPLAELIERAHAKGLEVQAWVNVYPVWRGNSPPPASVTPTPMYQDFSARYGQEWLQWKDGQPMALGQESYLAANPAHPAVRERVVAVCKDLLSRYALDGLHLDYVRYSGADYSDDPLSNREYAAALAQNPGLSRADWQRAQVTALVQQVCDEALPLRPGARLTTTAWPVYQDRWGWYDHKDGYGAYYQDSQAWARSGLVSAILPMIYGPTVHNYPDRYQALAQDYVEGSRPGAVILGVDADYDSFAEISRQIAVARQLGARGEALFSYGALNQHGFWQALHDGPYREPAAPDWP